MKASGDHIPHASAEPAAPVEKPPVPEEVREAPPVPEHLKKLDPMHQSRSELPVTPSLQHAVKVEQSAVAEEHLQSEEAVEAITKREILAACWDSRVRAVGFDMDGVLFDTNMSSSLRTIGLMRVASFVWRQRAFPSRQAFFDSLRVPVLARDTGGMSVVHQGGDLPSILTAWQCGMVSGPDAERDINAYFSSKECTLSASEREMFRGVAHLMLDPAAFVGTRNPLHKGHALLQMLTKRSPPLLLFGLSNWDTASFELLKSKHPEVFSLLKLVIISGDTKACKPHPLMFERMLERLRQEDGYADLMPSEIIFLDDEPANIEGANKAGLNGMHYVDADQKKHYTEPVGSAPKKTVVSHANVI